MITGIEIENFKGICERLRLEFRPITLLFGANSGGKSTILHALHYLREVFERQNLDPYFTLDGGEQLNLGGFLNLVHAAATDQEIGLAICIDASDRAWPTLDVASLPEDGREVEEEIFVSPDEFTVRVQIGWSSLEAAPYVRSVDIAFGQIPIARTVYQPGRTTFDVQLNVRHPSLTLLRDNDLLCNHFGPVFDDLSDENLTCLEALLVGAEPQQEASPGEALWHEMQLKGKSAWPSDVFARPSFFLGDETADGYIEQLLDDTFFRIFRSPIDVVREELESFLYIGPLRRLPFRNHEPQVHYPRSHWGSGIAAWDELYACSELHLEDVARWLSNETCLDTGYGIDRKRVLELDLSHPIIRRMYDGRAFDDVDTDEQLDLSRLPERVRLVITNESGCELGPHDVGTGISQVLPVIVATVVKEDHLISVEQPELHLHPRVQAALGDLFIEAVRRRRNWFIIETHSEHLILRLLRRIRETEVNKAPSCRTLRTDDLVIYYLKLEDGKSRALRVDVDVNGEFIQPWPDDFFEIDFYERFTTGENS